MNLKIVLADCIGSVGAILLGGTSVLCVCGAIEYRMPWMLVPAAVLGLLAWPCVRMALWADEQRRRDSMNMQNKKSVHRGGNPNERGQKLSTRNITLKGNKSNGKSNNDDRKAG